MFDQKPDLNQVDPNLTRDPIIFLVKLTRPDPPEPEHDPTRDCHLYQLASVNASRQVIE
jgi:hypothetical protein